MIKNSTMAIVLLGARKHARAVGKEPPTCVTNLAGVDADRVTKAVIEIETHREQVLAALDAPNPMQENLREAWAALALIREAIETLGPVGALPASENLDGPTFMHEAEVLVGGIQAMAKNN